MVPEDIKEQAEKLKKELRHHSYLYYVLARPEISDFEFDHMYRKLVDLEKAYPELVTPDSPTSLYIEGWCEWSSHPMIFRKSASESRCSRWRMRSMRTSFVILTAA